ncbi:MAG: hypothetical protein ACPLRU_01935, partial [Desulfofundulus sp.]
YTGVHKSLLERQQQLAADIRALEEEVERTEAAVALLHHLSNVSRQRLCEHLGSIVTRALQYVYGPDFSFELDLVTDRRGNTRLECYVVNGAGVRVRPQDNFGGSVDIVSIALRVGVLALAHNPPLPGPVILDEPGAHLDAEAAVKLGEFLRYVADTYGRQVILITHHDTIIPFADAAHRVTMVDGVSYVQKQS